MRRVELLKTQGGKQKSLGQDFCKNQAEMKNFLGKKGENFWARICLEEAELQFCLFAHHLPIPLRLESQFDVAARDSLHALSL